MLVFRIVEEYDVRNQFTKLSTPMCLLFIFSEFYLFAENFTPILSSEYQQKINGTNVSFQYYDKKFSASWEQVQYSSSQPDMHQKQFSWVLLHVYRLERGKILRIDFSLFNIQFNSGWQRRRNFNRVSISREKNTSSSVLVILNDDAQNRRPFLYNRWSLFTLIIFQ